MSNPHTRITNLGGSEAGAMIDQYSYGAPGTGAVAEPAGEREDLHKVELESTVEINTDGLRDIGDASFSPLMEAVLGTDERIRVPDTSLYPWRAMASLRITARDGSQWIGTAWFISARTLITAGHCVYLKNSDTPNREGWVKKIDVMPGRNGASMPFGVLPAVEFWTVKGWGEEGSELYDYGAIILPKPITHDVGTFGFAVLKDDTLEQRIINVAGYPGDKPGGSLWHDSREIVQKTSDKLFYEADTYGGQSGCPAYLIQPDKQRVAIGIHAYGGASSNSATRISAAAYGNLQAWMKH